MYDIFVTAPFATPRTLALLLSCLMGSLVMLWSFVRLGERSMAPGLLWGAARWLPVTPAMRPDRRSRASLTLVPAAAPRAQP